MAYTQEQLEELEQAIRSLQMGERVVSVTYDGHRVDYGQVQLSDLITLRDKVKAEVSRTSTRKTRQIRVITNKGL